MNDVEEQLQAAKTAFDDALGRLVGENIGANCDCSNCNKNRNEMRKVVTELIEAQRSVSHDKRNL